MTRPICRSAVSRTGRCGTGEDGRATPLVLPVASRGPGKSETSEAPEPGPRPTRQHPGRGARHGRPRRPPSVSASWALHPAAERSVEPRADAAQRTRREARCRLSSVFPEPSDEPPSPPATCPVECVERGLPPHPVLCIGTALVRPRAFSRRGAGVVDRGGLENRCTFTRTVGSNPTLSATSLRPKLGESIEKSSRFLNALLGSSGARAGAGRNRRSTGGIPGGDPDPTTSPTER